MDVAPANDSNQCIRCGECCLLSSSSLQTSDVSLVYEVPIKRSDLYTVRAGELVRDNVRGEMKLADKEIIKVRERENRGECIFYDDALKKCTIYEQRPVHQLS